MILFEEDWYKEENLHVAVHNETTNESFIRLHHILKKMGIKNNKFFLALHDERLKNVDPYSPTLTDQEIGWIVAECVANPWYYFREIAPVPEGSKKNRFRANRANISLIWSFFNRCQYLLIQPRQTGKSYSTDTLMVYILSFSFGIRTLLYTKDRPLATKNIIRLRKLFERMPEYLNPMTRDDSANRDTITVLKRGNYYNTIVAQDNEEDADKKGRGDTVEVRHADEIAYCTYNFVTMPTMGSAMNAAKEDAIAEGKVTGSIFTTTAGKKDSPHGAWAYEVFIESAEWNEKYYDCKDRDDFEKMVRKDSNPLDELAKMVGIFAIQGTFSHRQLGYTDEWLIGKIVENKVSPEAALRDYYNVWTSGNETSPFSTRQLQMISGSIEEVETRDLEGGITINWYYPMGTINQIMGTRPVVAGMDTSQNVGRDSTTITFVDATTLDILGTVNCNSVNLYKYATWLADLMTRFPKMVLVPENKSSAQGILDYLIEVFPSRGIDPFRRIFNTVVNDREAKPRVYDQVMAHPNRMFIANQHRNQFGYVTAGSGKYSRENLYNETLFRAIDISADKIKDERLIKELLALVLKDNRIDHPKGGHDDQVISWLLACWFIFNAREVQQYDIHRVRFLTDVVNAGEEYNPEEDMAKRRQISIRDTVKRLYEDLGEADSFIEFSHIEKQIRLLEGQLKGEYLDEVIGMSDMIEEMRNKRKVELMKSNSNIVNDILDGLGAVTEKPRAGDVMLSNGYIPNRRLADRWGMFQDDVMDQYSDNREVRLDSLDYWLN